MIVNKKISTLLIFFVMLFSACEKEYYDTKVAGEEFLAANANVEGVVELASGIQYKVINSNPVGDYPQFADASLLTIIVKYNVKFIDNVQYKAEITEEIELSGKTSEENFWLDIIPRMRTGEKWKVWVPYDYLYGSDGVEDDEKYEVDPYTVLIYEIELITAY